MITHHEWKRKSPRGISGCTASGISRLDRLLIWAGTRWKIPVGPLSEPGALITPPMSIPSIIRATMASGWVHCSYFVFPPLCGDKLNGVFRFSELKRLVSMSQSFHRAICTEYGGLFDETGCLRDKIVCEGRTCLLRCFAESRDFVSEPSITGATDHESKTPLSSSKPHHRNALFVSTWLMAQRSRESSSPDNYYSEVIPRRAIPLITGRSHYPPHSRHFRRLLLLF
jgi:hypothetical protein